MNITPMQMLEAELGGLYGSAVLQDISRTIELYDFYDGKGQDWETPVTSRPRSASTWLKNSSSARRDLCSGELLS